MASTSTVRDEGLGYLEEFIRAVQATRERLESGEDVEAVEDGLEAGAAVLEVMRGVSTIAVETAEHSVQADLVESMQTLAQLLAELARVEGSLQTLMGELEGEREQWDDEEQEDVERLQQAKAHVLENLMAVAESQVELKKAILDLMREDEQVQIETQRSLIAVAMGELKMMKAAILDVSLRLKEREVEEAAEKAQSCQMVMSVVMIVVAVIVAVVAVVAAIFTGGASIAVVAVVVAVVAAIVSLVVTTLSEEAVAAIVTATDEVLQAMGLEASAEVVMGCLSGMLGIMETAEAMAGELAPMLPHVPVVSDLAEGVQRVLSALNPFD